jgi:hypothetical protein
VFKGAAAQDHRFVVTAYSSGGRAGRGSAPVLWRKLLPLTAPTGLTAKQSAFDLDLSWSAVRNATGYQLRDEDDPSFDPAISSGTTYVAKNAIYSSHIFTVTAVNGSRTGQPATTSWTPKHKLSAGEMALAYRLPSSFVVPGSCQSSAPDSDYISAEVSCDPASPRSDGPTILYADQIKSGDESAYESRAFGSNLPSRAGCHNVYPASGTEGTWSSDGKTIGNEYCFLASNGDSVFAWTYSADSIVLQIQGAPPATRTGLNAWWYATPGTGLLR